MNLMMFELLFHPDAFSEIEALSPSMRAKALNALGLFELRAGNKDISRTFFAFAIGQKIYILRTFVKKTQKTPASEIELALKRLGEMTDESTTH